MTDGMGSQGCTPGTVADGPAYSSLEVALMDHKIPLENWQFIRRLTDGIGVASYHRTTGYIKAIRQEGGPDLHITYGYSNGFRSTDELRGVGGDKAEIWPSGRETRQWPEQWGVTHPVHGHPSGGNHETKQQLRDFGTCPKCNTSCAANGSCLCD